MRRPATTSTTMHRAAVARYRVLVGCLVRWALVAQLSLVAAAVAGDYALDWHTIDAGGMLQAIDGTYTLTGTVGQPEATVAPMAGGEFTLTGGFWPGVTVAPSACRGDSNCDGTINWRDIDFFVAAQNDNMSAWTALHVSVYGVPPGCPFENNDVDSSGSVTWRDIDPFVELQNTTCP